MGKLGVIKVQDFLENNTTVPKDFKGKFKRLRGISPETLTLAKKLIVDVQSAIGTLEMDLLDLDNWFWLFGDPTAGTFIMSNKMAY